MVTILIQIQKFETIKFTDNRATGRTTSQSHNDTQPTGETHTTEKCGAKTASKRIGAQMADGEPADKQEIKTGTGQQQANVYDKCETRHHATTRLETFGRSPTIPHIKRAWISYSSKKPTC